MSLGLGIEILRGSGASWQGGSVLFGDLMRALRENCHDELQMYLVEAVHGTPVPGELVPLADRVVNYPRLSRWSGTWAWNHLRNKITHADLLPDRVLREQGIELLLCGVLERRTTLPTLALITDFQHKHLPELFSPTEIRWRDAEFSKTAARASLVLVYSESVRADFIRFAPEHATKVRVLSPVSYIPPDIYSRPLSEILDAYGLPDKFIYLPNQFWQHKNHLTAFQAVRELRDSGTFVTLACTGAPIDSRSSSYFSEILQTIARWKIRDQIILLGSVPRVDVFGLIRQAVCILNPSRFEGFGLSLAEAHGVGKRVLASDIGPHREQNVPCAEYFDPGDPMDLASKLEAIWASTQPGPDLAIETQARQAQPARVRAYAAKFMEVAHEALQ